MKSSEHCRRSPQAHPPLRADSHHHTGTGCHISAGFLGLPSQPSWDVYFHRPCLSLSLLPPVLYRMDGSAGPGTPNATANTALLKSFLPPISCPSSVLPGPEAATGRGGGTQPLHPAYLALGSAPRDPADHVLLSTRLAPFGSTNEQFLTRVTVLSQNRGPAQVTPPPAGLLF